MYSVPDQGVTIDVSDQPLYAKSKEIQWCVPGYEESKYFAMIGFLHCEKVSFGGLVQWERFKKPKYPNDVHIRHSATRPVFRLQVSGEFIKLISDVATQSCEGKAGEWYCSANGPGKPLGRSSWKCYDVCPPHHKG